MTFEEFLSVIVNISIWSIGKIFVLLALFLYIIFSWLVIRQADLMLKTLTLKAVGGTIELPIRLIAWLQLVLAIVVFLVALVIL